MLTTIVIKIDWALRVSGSGYVGARRVCHKCWPCEGKGSRLEEVDGDGLATREAVSNDWNGTLLAHAESPSLPSSPCAKF